MIELHLNSFVENPSALLEQNFDGVIIASGEPDSIDLGIEGEQHTLSYLEYLRYPAKYTASGNVAVIGGGAVAVDCALTAVQNGAENVEMFVRRRVSDMRITGEERHALLEAGIDLTTMTRIKKIGTDGNFITLYTSKTALIRANWKKFPTPPLPDPASVWSLKRSAVLRNVAAIPNA